MRDGSDKLRETQMLATAEDDDLLHWKKLAAPVITAPPRRHARHGLSRSLPMAGGRRMVSRRWLGRTWHGRLRVALSLAGSAPMGISAQTRRRQTQWQAICQSMSTAAKCGSAPISFSSTGSYCLFYSTEGKVIWSTGDYDLQSIGSRRTSAAFSTAEPITRLRVFSRPTAAAFSGDGFAKPVPKPSMLLPDGQARCLCRACFSRPAWSA